MSSFATRLIAWQKQYGRHDLPWQNTRDPYAIWVSEIMLQQTQVSAVIGYYAKFMQRFPTIASLASASQEEVLQYWSGLGYYSRARNLHQAAIDIVEKHRGQFPQDFATIQTLPGIGRSTAAAIASFAFHQVQTILDGNVKRVLARHHRIEGWPGTPAVEKQLWALAESLLPAEEMVAYTQGLMDLGATLCTRSKPQCQRCPVQASCQAFLQGQVAALPTPKPRKVLPEKDTTMLVFMDGNDVMLEKRPAKGIWGGLWSFPEIINVDQHLPNVTPLEKLTHTFTHFKLHIQPQLVSMAKSDQQSKQPAIWLDLDDAIGAAIPTPVRQILVRLKQSHIDQRVA